MDELADFKTVMQRLRETLQERGNRRIYDSDLAVALRLPEGYIATLKYRNSIPYPKVLQFCKRLNIDPMTILFKNIP